MLLERVKSQDCTSNELGTQANEDEWKAKSRKLLEWEGEYKIICEKFLDLLNIRERYLAENEEELDEMLSCLAVPIKTEVKIVGVGQFIA